MTNREWLIKEMQNMSDEGLINTVVMCKFINSKNCDAEEIGCVECNKNWLKAEHKEKIKLSEVERVILANMAEDCKWIVRDSNGVLKIYYTKPIKRADTVHWYIPSGHIVDIPQYNHLFQFIKWSDIEPYNIKELLKGE